MGNKIVFLNGFDRLQGLFDFFKRNLDIQQKNYPGTTAFITAIKNKFLAVPDISLLMTVGCSDEYEPALYRKNRNRFRRFKNSDRLKKVPVLFLGYRGYANLKNECLDCGAEYSALPIKKNKLLFSKQAMRLIESAAVQELPQRIDENCHKYRQTVKTKNAPITIGKSTSKEY